MGRKAGGPAFPSSGRFFHGGKFLGLTVKRLNFGGGVSLEVESCVVVLVVVDGVVVKTVVVKMVVVVVGIVQLIPVETH